MDNSLCDTNTLLKAFGLAAASQGTMNNVAMGAAGDDGWDYYETMAGVTGAHARGAGLSAVHSHMTNTLNTPIESLESHYPLRVHRYRLRRGSGGHGSVPLRPGGRRARARRRAGCSRRRLARLTGGQRRHRAAGVYQGRRPVAQRPRPARGFGETRGAA